MSFCATITIVLADLSFIAIEHNNIKATIVSFSSPSDSIYLKDCEKIKSYTDGIDDTGKKRMILLTAAKYYCETAVITPNATPPIVIVEYKKDFEGHEIYSILSGSPLNLSGKDSISEVYWMGDCLDLFKLKKEPIITCSEFQRLGLNNRTDYIGVNEVSWYLMIDPNTMEHLLIKDTFRLTDCEKIFKEYLRHTKSITTIVSGRGT